MTYKNGPAVIPRCKHLLGGPADIEAHLRYARENIERSKMLFRKCDMRYALFSANEGLELCVKAYLLHYKIISDPILSGRFPYAALVRQLRKFVESSGSLDPGHGDTARLAHKNLDEFEAVFKMMQSRENGWAFRKLSLGIELNRREQKQVAQVERVILGWGGPVSHMRCDLVRARFMHDDRARPVMRKVDDLFVKVLGLFHMSKEQRCRCLGDTPFRDMNMTVDELLSYGQSIAYKEMFLYTSDILNGYVHQQTSRYPTIIDGVDAGEYYLRHRGGVKLLLARIRRTSGMLMRHLNASSPPILRSPAALLLLWGFRP